MLIDQAHEVALNVLRPISRKYDKAEHAYPKELDMLASLVDGMNEGGEGMNAGAAGAGKRNESQIKATVMAPIYLQHSASLKCAMEIQGYY
jgi:acyl-CoA dehydrogenase